MQQDQKTESSITDQLQRDYKRASLLYTWAWYVLITLFGAALGVAATLLIILVLK
jgi:hypothetical protein